MVTKNKKAFYFTLDALFALLILISVITMIPHTGIKSTESKYKNSYLQEDALNALTTIKTSEINNSAIQSYLLNTTYNESFDRGDSLIETISKLWATGYEEDAKNIAAEFFGDTIQDTDNFGFFFRNKENQLEPIFLRNVTPMYEAQDLVSNRFYVSGVEKGQNITGYAARAFLQKKESTKIAYFGGYIGDGNVTLTMDLPNVTQVKNISIELVQSISADLYLNDHFIQTIPPALNELTPTKIYLPNDTFQYIENGTNYFDFKNYSPIQNVRIAISGGYIQIIYKTNSPTYSSTKRQYLPGLSGIINEYDSLYAPNTITSMNAQFHYQIVTDSNQNVTIFLKIGNTTVYRNTSTGPVYDYTKTLSSPEILSSLGSYDNVSNKTIPTRFGFEEFGEGTGKGNADVILITDLSRSMNQTLVNNETGIRRICTDENLSNNDTARVSLAICVDEEFINNVLKYPGNRMAIVGLFGDGSSPYKGRTNRTEVLTSNAEYLKKMIRNYNSSLIYDGRNPPEYITPIGGGCLCCALNSAYSIFNTSSNSSRKKYIIAMSDGLPIYRCMAGGGDKNPNWWGNVTGWPDESQPATASCSAGQGAVGEASDTMCTGNLEDNECKSAIKNANYSACRAYNELKATIYAVGFGPVDECEWANTTLKEVAKCGHGRYYYSDNATTLAEIYRNISEEILGLSYEEQKINISGNFTSTLYPDSYIEYEYTPVPFTSGLPLGDGGGYDELVTKYGNVLTYETPHFSNSQVSFNFTEGVTLDAVAVSYSGAKWTKYVSINNTQTGNFLTIFNLSDFGTFYTTLGDPFRINLPATKIIPTSMNTVKLKIANSSNPAYERDASDSDKVIYTLLLLSNYSYSNITNNADGCHWYIEYFDGSTDQFNVPSNYSNGNDCHFDSSHGSTNGCLDEETDTIIQQDAIAQATYLVLRNYLDRNPKDCKLDIKISDYSINTFILPAVPFLSYTTAEVMSWR